MKLKNLLFAFSAALFFGSGYAQQNGWCGSDYVLDLRVNGSEEILQQIHEDMMEAAAYDASGAKVGLKTIPVVFHILHDNGIGNISDEQCQSALDVLNRDFNRLNADTANTRQTANAPFKQYAASMEMEFRMARIDPNGNCTNGIIRKNVGSTGVTYNVDMNSEPHKSNVSGGSSAWPRNKYFNIWIVNSIDPGGAAGTILGYAQFPQSWGGSASTYGITMRHDETGTIGTAQGGDGRTFTHEVGHCFGLFHIFGQNQCSNNGNGGGDYCADTPPQYAADYTCSQTLNTCSTVPSNDPYGFDVLDQIENYMSYNICQNMFSADQAGIMESNFTTISWLNQLGSSANATATGISLPDALCRADFEASKTTICAGESVQFTDISYNYVNGWDWTFNGGTPATSTAQNPTITFNTPGLYEISLTASDGANTDTEAKTAFIRVLPSANTLPFLETFEIFSTLNGVEEWEVYDGGNNAKFEITTPAAHTGARSAKLANFGQAAGNVDELSSAPVDLSGITSTVTMSFRYAYRMRSSANDEWLKVYVTGDCGDSWVQRKTLHGTMLTNQVETNSWEPTSQADWVTVHMTNVTSQFWVDNFRYKFRFESDGGNNFFLDDINIYASTPSDDLVQGVEDNEIVQQLNLYPNPAQNELNVDFTVANNQSMVFSITDVTGKIVQTTVVNANAGANLVLMDTEALSSGMYFLRIEGGGSQQTQQFVVK